MPVTLRYANGSAAVFASEPEALAQAGHDRQQPGHLDPAYLIDGDHSATHAEWGESPPEGVTVLHGPEQLAAMPCDCNLCSWHRMPHEERLASFERNPAR